MPNFSGVRSVSFNENILTIGTGLDSVLFYDLTAGKYLLCNCGHTCILSVGHGYLVSLISITKTFMRNLCIANNVSCAIQTHSDLL